MKAVRAITVRGVYKSTAQIPTGIAVEIVVGLTIRLAKTYQGEYQIGLEYARS